MTVGGNGPTAAKTAMINQSARAESVPTAEAMLDTEPHFI